jgi:hypothetical protein
MDGPGVSYCDRAARGWRMGGWVGGSPSVVAVQPVAECRTSANTGERVARRRCSSVLSRCTCFSVPRTQRGRKDASAGAAPGGSDGGYVRESVRD